MERAREDRTPWVLLRLGVAACFVGHGAFGLMRKEAWVPYFGIFGIDAGAAHTLMPVVGAVDVAVGVMALVAPFRAVFGWAVAWCVWTALLRPMAGEPVWETLERAGNYGLPLALLALAGVAGWWRSPRAWLGRAGPRLVRFGASGGGMAAGPAAPPPGTEPSAERPGTGSAPMALAFEALRWTTVALLVGHGMLALGGKPLLAHHLATVGVGAGWLPVVAWIELALAAAVAARPMPALFVGIAAWKLATEALYPLAGAPIWEVVERGGSYAAPLAAAWMGLRWRVGKTAAGVADGREVGSGAAPGAPSAAGVAATAITTSPGTSPATSPGSNSWALAAALPGALLVPALLASGMMATTAGSAAGQATLPGLGQELLAGLRDGGYVLACRHAATDYSRMDARNLDLDDPSTQRVLSEAGIEQAERFGEDMVRLGIPFGEVLASPLQRTFRSAELMFGTATREDALMGMGDRARVRELLSGPVPPGTNRALVTHQGVLYQTLDRPHGSIGEAVCLVLRGGDDTLTPLAQIGPGDWRDAGVTGAGHGAIIHPSSNELLERR